MTAQTKSIAIVNSVAILIVENGHKVVPIKPICEALEIDLSAQLQRIKEDPILGSVVGLSPTTGRDGKTYEMQCIQLKYVFGWLFRIDSRNVKEEAREGVIQYKLQCYDALYDYFTSYMDFVNEKQAMTETELTKLEEAKKNFKTARDVMYKAEVRLKVVRGADFDQYRASGNQLNLFPDETQE